MQKEIYLPSKANIYNAFTTLPLENTKYILFGQDPYPREISASGYAFIDKNVKTLFCEKGLSREVNRATSLRNMMKLFLGLDTQEEIAKLDKSNLINSIDALRLNFEKNGVLLLNRSLVYTSKQDIKNHTKQWKPFVETLLLKLKDRDIKLILFGNNSKEILSFEAARHFEVESFEHPYNVSFVKNQRAKKLFGSMGLLFA